MCKRYIYPGNMIFVYPRVEAAKGGGDIGYDDLCEPAGTFSLRFSEQVSKL